MIIPKIEEKELIDFEKTIEKCLENKEYMHKSELKQIKKDFEKYVGVMQDAFTDKQELFNIYTFRVQYKFSKKTVWRDIECLGRNNFCELAEYILLAMDWENDHMHGFSLMKVNGKAQQPYTEFSIYAPGWEDDQYPSFKTDKIMICQLDYAKHPKLNFVFDFGDGFEFFIIFKGQRKARQKELQQEFPMLVDQRGVSPPQYRDFDNEK